MRSPADLLESIRSAFGSQQLDAGVFRQVLAEAGSALSHCRGRGIIITVEKRDEIPSAWVAVRAFKQLNSTLPVEIWHSPTVPLRKAIGALLARIDVPCMEARALEGISLKARCLFDSSFEEVLLLQADNLVLRDPELLFGNKRYAETGAIFWPGPTMMDQAHPIWKVETRPCKRSFDGANFLVNKRAVWEELQLANWLGWHPGLDEPFKRLEHGMVFVWHWLEKDAAKVNIGPEFLGTHPGHGMVCQHDFDRERIFQRRGWYKWHIHCENPRISGAVFDSECRTHLQELKAEWDGRLDGDCVGSEGPLPARYVTLREELIGSVWVVEELGSASPFRPLKATTPKAAEVPEAQAPASNRSKLPDGMSHETFWGRKFREFSFKRNGHLGETSDRRLQFWNLTEADDPLRIFGDPKSGGAEWTLRPVAKGEWTGKYRFRDEVREITLRTVERLYPGSVRLPKEGASADDSDIIARDLRERFGSPLHVVNSGLGIGDQVMTLYAVTAAADTGLQVIFHTRHPGWVSRASHPGVTIDAEVPGDWETAIRSGAVVDVNRNYNQQIRYGASRARWYASNIHPLLRPKRPSGIDRTIGRRRFDFDRYAILAPCGSARNRNWPVEHWKRLILSLRADDFEVVAIGTKREAKKIAEVCENVGAFWAIDHSPEWVIDAVLGASVIIANDSGMTHIGGLLQIPTVAIHAQLGAAFLWDCTDIVGVTPQTDCVECRWLLEKGYHLVCDEICSALGTITPDRVMEAVRRAVSGGRAKIVRNLSLTV